MMNNSGEQRSRNKGVMGTFLWRKSAKRISRDNVTYSLRMRKLYINSVIDVGASSTGFMPAAVQQHLWRLQCSRDALVAEKTY